MSLTAAQVQAKKSEITAAGGVFELESVRIDGREFRTYKHAPKTLVEVMDGARAHGDMEFVVYEDERLTYNEFFARVDAFAAVLQREFDIRKGNRVAIAMRNNPAWVISFAAIAYCGAIAVPINSWGKTEELRYALEDSTSELLICDSPRLNLIAAVLGDLDLQVIVVDNAQANTDDVNVQPFERLLVSGGDQTLTPVAVDGQDSVVILYTSGSTGFPKGVLHRHIGLCQSLMNMFFLGYLLMELEGPREFRGGAERETPLLTVPLFHATGLLAGFVLPIHTAQKVVMMRKWDANHALELIQAEKVTGLSSVPAVIQDLLAHPKFDQFDTQSLIRVGAAGAATPAGLAEKIREKCGEPSRSAGWGMTETFAVGGSMSGAVFDLSPDSAGLVSPIVDLRFLDAQAKIVEPSTGGEMEIRSVTCTPGYWQKPEANAQTFDDDHWMKTGDLGRVDDDGFLHITGRIKEIVIRGGENIYPGEIEQAVYELEQVKENVVFGVPDEAMGEELALVLYLKPDMQLAESELRDYLKRRLASYKVPKHIQLAEQPLPQNASGKLHKLKVREEFIKNQGLA